MATVAAQIPQRKTPIDRREKDPSSAIFELGDRLLFVPTEDMWTVREQSEPAAVLRRCGLNPHLFSKWKWEYKSHPWLFRWLYRHREP